MVIPEQSEVIDITERFFTAYNETDIDTLRTLFTDEVRWGRHNSGFMGNGREKLLQVIREIQTTVPDRCLGKTTRRAVTGNVVYTENLWSGTPVATAAGFQAGVNVALDCASVFIVEGGRISEWTHYT